MYRPTSGPGSHSVISWQKQVDHSSQASWSKAQKKQLIHKQLGVGEGQQFREQPEREDQHLGLGRGVSWGLWLQSTETSCGLRKQERNSLNIQGEPKGSTSQKTQLGVLLASTPAWDPDMAACAADPQTLSVPEDFCP